MVACGPPHTTHTNRAPRKGTPIKLLGSDTRFSGPGCWTLTGLVGVLVGVVLGLLFPGQHTEQDRDSANPADVKHVVQVSPKQAESGAVLRGPDGAVLYEAFERLADNTAVPVEIDRRNKPVFRNDAPVRVSTGPDDQPDSQADRRAGSEPAEPDAKEPPQPVIPLILCAPFALLLLSIAVMPFVNPRFWHEHFPDFAFFLGGLVAAYYLVALADHGAHHFHHAVVEYYQFLALVGGLFVVSGGVLIDLRGKGGPVLNTALLAFGAIIANVVGTTGASMLLIRPFMRINKGRLRPLHIVFFIFIVSNCGGCLTPIGDPPLYLGYLKGVPFEWTILHLWPMWALVCGVLLVEFFLYDSIIKRRDARTPGSRTPPDAPEQQIDPLRQNTPNRFGLALSGVPCIVLLALMIACVFIDKVLYNWLGFRSPVPIGATIQIVIAITSYFIADPEIHAQNTFDFGPVKEVGLLFAGIFMTMMPALDYLRVNASGFGLDTPGQFYFATGFLSGGLDNAPTYLSFLQMACGTLHIDFDPAGLKTLIGSTFYVQHHESVRAFRGETVLASISLSAVFFGAMTYIGNGPNFMVKSITDAAYVSGKGLGVRMPSFFGYVVLSFTFLAPPILLCWLLFIH